MATASGETGKPGPSAERLLEGLRTRYEEMRTSTDVVEREIGRRQLQHLDTLHRGPGRAGAGAVRPASRWAHADLALLLVEAGNRVERRGTRIRSGHEPLHDSKSGSCVRVDAVAGRWSCASCRRGGDAATLLMDIYGITYPAAVARLVDRFGHPEVWHG